MTRYFIPLFALAIAAAFGCIISNLIWIRLQKKVLRDFMAELERAERAEQEAESGMCGEET